MISKMFGLLAETNIHPGSGQDGGLIDKPVAREAATDYPVTCASAFKGALRDLVFWEHYNEAATDNPDEAAIAKAKSKAREVADKEANKIFGESDNAGSIIPSDIRILLLPIRSLSASYYWVTCPMIL